MAFEQFPDLQYFVVLDTDDNSKLGYFTLTDGTDLRHAMLTIYVKGAIDSPFEMWLNIYGNDRLEGPIYASNRAVISSDTLEPSYTDGWLGNVYFDFEGVPLNPNHDYFITCETDGYAKDGEDFYVGVNLDWYFPVNEAVTPTQAGARIRLLGKS